MWRACARIWCVRPVRSSASAQQSKTGDSGLALFVDFDLPVGILRPPGQWRIHLDEGLWQAAGHQAQIELAEAPFPEQRRKVRQRQTTARQHQAAAGFTVQPVGQFEVLAIAVLPQCVDQAPGQSAARMDGHARGLVDNQDVGVFMDNRAAQLLADLIRYGAGPVTADPGRGNPNLVPLGEARGGPGAAAVDANLPRADHTVDGRPGYALEIGGEKIIQPLTVVVPVDSHKPYPLVVTGWHHWAATR